MRTRANTAGICGPSCSIIPIYLDPVRVPIIISKSAAGTIQPRKKSSRRRAKLVRELENPILNFIVVVDFRLVIEFG